MKKWVQINDKVFYYKEISTQMTIGAHGTSNLSLDMNQNPDAYDYLTKLYDMKFSLKVKKDIAFTLRTSSVELLGCMIKHMDFDFNSGILNLDIISDYMVMVDIKERRDERIDQILNKTSEENNNIN